MKQHCLLLLFSFSIVCFAQDAKEMVRKADEKYQGEKTSQSVMQMVIKRPTYERSLQFKNWVKDRDYSITLITAPAAEKGQSFLKRKNEMWMYDPRISRMIKLPPSMMSQGWMGSDYTNDDVLRESSIVRDYSHSFLNDTIIDGRTCVKIKLIPKEEAAIVWGKVYLWISKEDYLMLQSEYYDEDEYLVKTEKAHTVKELDGRSLPTVMEIIPADKPDQKTVITIQSILFNKPISDSFFTQQNMKRLR